MASSGTLNPRLQRWARTLRITLAVIVALLVGGSSLYAWVTLHWDYSDGTRAGLLQKFDRKGWLCKTYEGELALSIVSGIAPQIWYFSVRDDKVAGQVSQAVGQKVQLHYTEHRGVPSSCFADTRYFVDGITVVPQ